ncbi:minor capsid protein [Lacticaseibacillus saniviri]|uniref:Phage head morphogenesis domain-containing protein n=1 Tax=Lacticaseibacillus saniviri JCM 17471 = DSM 24301 TaxID=1293598 RepID=A0A0R2MST4_9LACO|nr:minor capsid protein [Lacticaseibacillus saniviri]KRO16638.1 hypothetical protein IV56_GL001084 [Lacticaseibacillus saniviri JCM 17471 = DSM 24301]
MNNRNYWKRRFLQLKVDSIRRSASYEHDLTQRLIEARGQLDIDLDGWYQRYADTKGDIDKATAQKLLKGARKSNWQMGLDEFKAKAKQGGYEDELDLEYITSRVSRLQELQFQMQQTMTGMALSEQKRFAQALGDDYEQTYMRNLYTLNQAGVDIASEFAHFNQGEVDMIVSQPWMGKNFSSRLWGNLVNDLPDLLTTGISKAVLLGYSYERVEREMHKTLKDFTSSQIHRLVITEMAHVSETATAASYEAGGIERYEYLATLESHTCEICAKLDGKKFKVSERVAGANYPPIHAHCRCTTVPTIEGLEDLPSRRWQRDPVNGKGFIGDSMTFDQWLHKDDPKSEKPVVPKKPIKRRYKPVTQKTLKEHAKYIKGLPVEQQDAIINYTGSDYSKINRALRNGRSMGKKTAETEERLAKAVDRELGQDMNVFRGLEKLPSDIFDGLSDNQAKALKRAVKVANTPIPDNILEKINTELASIDTAKITDEGYMSTTRQTAVTKTFSSKVFLDLSVDKEVHGLSVEYISKYKKESEILLNKGAIIKVQGIQLDPNHGLVIKGVISND